MKVSGTGGLSQSSGAKPARGGGGDGFRVATPGPAAAAQPASSVGTTAGVMGVDALIALQEVGSPLERRRRSVGRANQILDVLEGLRIALLDGEVPAADLERLGRAIREQRMATDDPALEDLLDQIETRAAVEMAKLESGGRAA